MRRLAAICFPALAALGTAQAATAQAATAPPIPAILSITDMGVVAQSPYIQLRDGTYSALIDGASYWSFNDTGMTASNAAGNNFIDNSLAWATSLDATSGITLNSNQTGANGVPIRFIPFTPGEQTFQTSHDPAHCTVANCGENLALWGGGLVQDPVSRLVIQSFGEVVRGGTIKGFHGVGAGMAVGTVLKNGYLKLTRPVQSTDPTHPTLMWGPDDQAFTDSVAIVNGFYYAYGSRQNGLALEVLLARVPVGKLLNKAAWTYYAGNGVWSTNVADCAALFDGGSAGSSIFYNAYLKEWMTVYTGVFSNTLYYRVGAAPEGPWSDETVLFQGQDGYDGTVDYSGKAHPEFSPDGGKTLYVTYVHSPANFVQDLPLTKIIFSAP